MKLKTVVFVSAGLFFAQSMFGHTDSGISGNSESSESSCNDSNSTTKCTTENDKVVGLVIVVKKKLKTDSSSKDVGPGERVSHMYYSSPCGASANLRRTPSPFLRSSTDDMPYSSFYFYP